MRPVPLLRWSVPVITGRRGAGLGNEVIPWAKAFLAAQECDLRLIRPAWGLNPRGYWRDFGTSRLDWPLQRGAARVLPTLNLDWDMVRNTGQADYGRAVRELLSAHPRHRTGPLLVRHTSAMQGGFYSIRRARLFILRELLKAPGVVDDLYRHVSRNDRTRQLRIAVHVRGGDFANLESGPTPGKFNQRIPVRWYVSICRRLRARLQKRVLFEIFTDDRNDSGVAAIHAALGTDVVLSRTRSAPADLLSMAEADALVCSVSSYSMLAAFLSNKPYVWYGPHWSSIHTWRGLWAFDPEEQQGQTGRHAAQAQAEGLTSPWTRGVSGEDDGYSPDWLVEYLEHASTLGDPLYDLLLFGVVPARQE